MHKIYPRRCRQSPRVVTSAALWISPHLQRVQHRHSRTHTQTHRDTQKHLPHSILFLWIFMCIYPDPNYHFRGFLHELVTNWSQYSIPLSVMGVCVPSILFLWEYDAQIVCMSWDRFVYSLILDSWFLIRNNQNFPVRVFVKAPPSCRAHGPKINIQNWS